MDSGGRVTFLPPPVSPFLGVGRLASFRDEAMAFRKKLAFEDRVMGPKK